MSMADTNLQDNNFLRLLLFTFSTDKKFGDTTESIARSTSMVQSLSDNLFSLEFNILHLKIYYSSVQFLALPRPVNPVVSAALMSRFGWIRLKKNNTYNK